MGFDVRVLDLSDPRRAAEELGRVGADAVGVGKMRDKAAFLALKACGVKAPAANILKQEMLSLGGEAAVGRGVVNCSVERTDAIILGTRKQLKGLVRKLRAQPFGLKALGQEIETVIGGLGGSFELPWRGGALHLSERPHVMGVLNVTPDSFSDGGDFIRREAALDRGLQMVEEGADILDVGGESSRPGVAPVSEDEELARVLPVIEYLAPRIRVPVSIDTYKASVARRAVEGGASMVNDISALRFDPNMARVVAEVECPVALMHMRGTPRTMQTDTRYDDLVTEVYRSLRESIEIAAAAGVSRDRIVVDPGIGFGKDARGNLVLLQRLGELSSLGYPVMVGVSRKSFVGQTLGIESPKERLFGSIAAAVVSVWNGAHIVRAHDVRATREAVSLAWAVRQAREE